ncbi:type II toxin-antitoxin system TacA family antitoxin [Escherichia coli]
MEVVMPTTASIRKTSRENQINIRATDEERAVIDYAARLVNKNRTDFIIELAYQEAKNIILDQRLFVLDDECYDSFITQLEAPVQNAEGRERLMAVKPEWK